MAGSLRQQIEEVALRYPNRRSAIMPALFLAQDKYAQLSGEVLLEVSQVLDVPEIWVYEVATFYSLFNTEAVGKYHIQLCTNVSCLLLHAGGLLAHLEQRLGIERGGTTTDGLFTLSTVECLGACERAPVLMVNERYHQDLDIERVDQLLDQLRAKAGNGHV